MSFNGYLSGDSKDRLDQSYDTINKFYSDIQPHELNRLDQYLNKFDDDTAYGTAERRALSGASTGMAPNVVQAGALPNVRAMAPAIQNQQSALIGGAAVNADLSQQGNYANALQRVVAAGKAHRGMANYGVTANSQMDNTVAGATQEAKQMRSAAIARLAGGAIGAGAGWLSSPSSAGVSAAKEGLEKSTELANTPGYADAIGGGATTNSLLADAGLRYTSQVQALPSNAGWLGNQISSGISGLGDWISNSHFGQMLQGTPPTPFNAPMMAPALSYGSDQ